MSRLSQTCRSVVEQTAPERFFTADQADRSLVLIRRIVADVVTEFRCLLDQQEVAEQASVARCRVAHNRAQEQIRQAFGRLETFRDELHQVGAELKDWLRGVVHFPCLVGGQRAWLCWRYDEPHVKHWHYAETSCADRQHLAQGPGEYQPACRSVHEAVQSARRVV